MIILSMYFGAHRRYTKKSIMMLSKLINTANCENHWIIANNVTFLQKVNGRI